MQGREAAGHEPAHAVGDDVEPLQGNSLLAQEILQIAPRALGSRLLGRPHVGVHAGHDIRLASGRQTLDGGEPEAVEALQLAVEAVEKEDAMHRQTAVGGAWVKSGPGAAAPGGGMVASVGRQAGLAARKTRSGRLTAATIKTLARRCGHPRY